MKEAILFLFLFNFLIISSASAQAPEITNGLSYLTSSQNPDGFWGYETTSIEIIPSTVSVIETLQILDQTSLLNYSNAISWLQSQPLETTDYLSERIYALSVLGTDGDLLLSYLDDLTGAWGGYDDFEVNNFDTTLALKALNRTQYSDQEVISYALGYLLSTQNTDGGWGFYEGDESNVYMTALVLKVLSSFNGIYDLQTEIDNAVAYIIAKQNTDGGFGSSSSTVYETSLTFEALISSNADISAIASSAINYLLTTQLPNGSWEDDPYSTALALRALANVKPNLSISSSDITFSNPTPTVGETITITANIKNTGPSQADNVSVQFYDGDLSSGDFRNYRC
jgi:squalene cyclase